MAWVVGSVVQLVRMPPCHGGGRGFESRPVRLILVKTRSGSGFCFFYSILYSIKKRGGPIFYLILPDFIKFCRMWIDIFVSFILLQRPQQI